MSKGKCGIWVVGLKSLQLTLPLYLSSSVPGAGLRMMGLGPCTHNHGEKQKTQEKVEGQGV